MNQKEEIKELHYRSTEDHNRISKLENLLIFTEDMPPYEDLRKYVVVLMHVCKKLTEQHDKFEARIQQLEMHNAQ